MAFIDWTDKFSVNVAQIDTEHKKLISLINDLYDAMKAGKGKDVIGNVLNDLINYTATHFKTEENYFNKFTYPGAVRHNMEHAAFVKKVTDFKNKFEQGKLGLSIEVMNFLKDWLKDHILVSDMKYTQFFKEKGLK